jgi:hypothetical protein
MPQVGHDAVRHIIDPLVSEVVVAPIDLRGGPKIVTRKRRDIKECTVPNNGLADFFTPIDLTVDRHINGDLSLLQPVGKPARVGPTVLSATEEI